MPVDAKFPEPEDNPTLENHLFNAPKPWEALDDVMEAIEGDGSAWSYLAASVLRRELREFGASWHGIDWGTHCILEDDPWTKPPEEDGFPPSRPSTPASEWKWSAAAPTVGSDGADPTRSSYGHLLHVHWESARENLSPYGNLPPQPVSSPSSRPTDRTRKGWVPVLMRRNQHLPKDVVLQWPGRLPRFSRMLEGGPGRPRTLIVMAGLAMMIVWQGMRMIDRSGIDGAGPALMLLGAAWLLFLLVWVLIKAVLRDPSVIFYITEQGVGILPSVRQRSTDEGLSLLMRLVFLLTFRGGQWSAWKPFTTWKEARRVETNDVTRHTLISGGIWDIRLICETDHYEAVKVLIRDRIRTLGKPCTFVSIEET
jgi:hypothetical protein